jgi:hypothetical protein
MSGCGDGWAFRLSYENRGGANHFHGRWCAPAHELLLANARTSATRQGRGKPSPYYTRVGRLARPSIALCTGTIAYCSHLPAKSFMVARRPSSLFALRDVLISHHPHDGRPLSLSAAHHSSHPKNLRRPPKIETSIQTQGIPSSILMLVYLK